MKIPKYYLKPFGQAKYTALITKEDWDELRKKNAIPIKDGDRSDWYSLQDPQLDWLTRNIPSCGLTKRLEMEEKKG